jgi:segregation and condensation protein B
MDNIYNSVIEALVFASDEPLTTQEIINAVRGIDGLDTEISEEEIEAAVAELNRNYEATGSAFTILRISHGFSFATRPNHAKYVGFLSTEKSKRRLSNAALETLAIIAYKQPLTKPELEMIRGVNSDYTLNTLMEKNLVTISGRAETVGRPLLYVTTDEFLKYFGLHSIADLPKPREIEEIMKDEDFLEQKRKIMMGGLEEEAEAEEALHKDDDDDIVEKHPGAEDDFEDSESVLADDNTEIHVSEEEPGVELTEQRGEDAEVAVDDSEEEENIEYPNDEDGETKTIEEEESGVNFEPDGTGEESNTEESELQVEEELQTGNVDDSKESNEENNNEENELGMDVEHENKTE